MSQVIDKLEADHAHIARLLKMLKEQVRLIHAGENPDAALMQDIMVYMTHYPDLIHHPLEDLMFEHVIRLEPSARETLRSLSEQHDSIARIGHELKVSVDCLESEALIRRDVLDEQATNYLDLMHGHMKIEEEYAFPLARKLLDEDEWEQIRSEFKVKDHEIFGEALDGHYEALYHAISGSPD